MNVVDLVRRTHPACGFTSFRQPLQVVRFSFQRGKLHSVVVQLAVRYLKDCLEHRLAELLPDSLLQRFLRVSIADAVFDHVVKNPGHYGVFVAVITRENDRHVRGMGEVGKLRSLSHLAVVMLGRKRKCVVDLVRVPLSQFAPAVRNHCTISSSPSRSSSPKAARSSESMSSTAISSPERPNTGTTISDLARASHAM